MKKIYFILFFALLGSMGLSQSCLPEGIVFSTQSQIDNFKSNYPNCTVIEGDVLISGNNITNLQGLNEVVTIGGDLTIKDNPNLSGLSGLNAFHHLQGSLFVYNNEALRTLSGLEDLFLIDGSLRVSNNDALVSLNGLVNLISVGGDLTLDSNLTLSDIHSLFKLQSIGNSIGTGMLNVFSNSSLTSLSGLDNIDPGSIGEIHIYSNPLLSNCDLASICVFLDDNSGIIDIYDNQAGCNDQQDLEEDCADNCLPGGIQIFDQEQIDSIPILYPDCKEIMGRVVIDAFFGNVNNLLGLSNINTINGYLLIGHCPEVKSFIGLDSLSIIYGSLLIDSMDSLENLHHLENLTSIWGGLTLDNLSMITDLSGLGNLNYIGNGMTIIYNALLNDLTSLENLTNLGGSLYVYDNLSLPSLSGLDNIESGSISYLHLVNNPMLSVCEINSICDYLLNSGGSANIANNLSGCNNTAEILDKCEVNIYEKASGDQAWIIYPNPTSSVITVDIDLPGVDLNLYNVSGQSLIRLLLSQSHSIIDIADLPSGVYFVQLSDTGNVKMFKVVKY